MSTDRRNPYVILGIPFGSSTQAARSGFARMSRRVKSDPSSRYTLEDLTWALHQIEQIVEDPELAFHIYRLPANPDATNAVRGSGVFNPPPIRLPRRSVPGSEEQIDDVKIEALRLELRSWLGERDLPNIAGPFERKEDNDA